jgi:hypothetical protein
MKFKFKRLVFEKINKLKHKKIIIIKLIRYDDKNQCKFTTDFNLCDNYWIVCKSK